LSLQGFTYDGPAKSIGFNPIWKPDNHVSFFTASEGWGNYVQTRNGSEQHSQIKVEYGRIELDEISIGVENNKLIKCSLALNGKEIKTKWQLLGSGVKLSFAPIIIEKGDVITVKLFTI
jgi:hypothetical protein